MTDQSPPDLGGGPSQSDKLDSAKDAGGPATDAPPEAGGTAEGWSAAAPAAPAGAGWVVQQPPATPAAPAAPAGAGWVVQQPPAAPPPGSGWSAYVAPAAPAGPAPGWQYAGFWVRTVAWIIDGFILGFLTTALTLVFFAVLAALIVGGSAATNGGTTGVSTGTAIAFGLAFGTAALAFLVAVFVVTIGYFVVLWVRRGGTFGQTLLGLRVARESDGAPIGWGTAIVRYVVLLVSFWIFYLGVIWVAFESRKRGWHDIVAGTVVVKRG